MTLADLIREELQKEDILKDIKEPLIKAMTAQFKKQGYAHIRWGYETLYGDKDEFGEYITVVVKGRRKVELLKWLSEQGFNCETTYNIRGAISGVDVTLY